MKRIVQIDALRGLMLVLMTVDHLFYGPFVSVDFILDYTCQTFGYVSAAEGFYFLSGIVTGMVFGGMLIRGQVVELRSRANKRAREIYLTNIAVFCILTLSVIGFKAVLQWGDRFSSDMLIYNDPLIALGLGAVFLHLPYLFEVLPLYCFYLLITPTVLKSVAKGRTFWVLSLSTLLWLLAQFFTHSQAQTYLRNFFPAELGYFDLFAWQILFVLGLVLGFHKRWGILPRFLKEPPRWLTSVVIVAAAGLFAERHGLLEFLGLSLVGPVTGISSLGPVRLVNFALVAFLIYRLAGRYQPWFEVRWLAYLGQHSLYVFAYHVVLYYGLRPVAGNITALGLAPKLLLLALVIASLTIPAWVHQRIRAWYRESRARHQIPPAVHPASPV